MAKLEKKDGGILLFRKSSHDLLNRLLNYSKIQQVFYALRREFSNHRLGERKILIFYLAASSFSLQIL